MLPLTPNAPYSESIQELRLLLELSPRSTLIFCLYRSPEDIKQVQKELETFLDIPIQHEIIDHRQLNPLQLLTDLPSEPRRAVFAQYEGDLNKELTRYARLANSRREVLNAVDHALVMWFREEAFSRFIRQAPDFWAWHSAVLEFQSPAPATVREALFTIESREAELGSTDRATLTARAQSYQNLLNAYGKPTPQDLTYLLRLNLRLAGTLYSLTDYESALGTVQEAEALLKSLNDKELRGDLLDLKGTILIRLSRKEESLAAIEEAVSLRRGLAKIQPELSLPSLAMSLNNLAASFSELGRQEEALAAAEEAVSIYRDLAENRPEAFSPDLAGSLNTLSTMLSNLGEHETAFTSVEEATSIYRDLAKGNPGVFLPSLAMSLNNLAASFSELGRREEALAAAEEAVSIYHDLAEDRPEAFSPDLAGSLANLNMILSGLNRKEEALSTIQESVSIYRDLVEVRPEVFLFSLAKSLSNMSNTLSELGSQEAALVAIEEAIAIAETQLKMSSPNVTNLYSTKGSVLQRAGQPGEASRFFKKGIEILEPYYPTYAQAFDQLMRFLIGSYLEASRKASMPVDESLIERIIERPS